MNSIKCRGTVKFYDNVKNHFGFVTIDTSENKQFIGRDAYIEKIKDKDAYIPRDRETLFFTVNNSGKGPKVDSIRPTAVHTIESYEEWFEVLTHIDRIAFFDKLQKENLLSKHPMKLLLCNQLAKQIPLTDPHIKTIQDLLSQGEENVNNILRSRINDADFSILISVYETFSSDEIRSRILSLWSSYSLEDKWDKFEVIKETEQLWVLEETDWGTAFDKDDSGTGYSAFFDLLELGYVSEELFEKVNVEERFLRDIPFNSNIILKYHKILEYVFNEWVKKPEIYLNTRPKSWQAPKLSLKQSNQLVKHWRNKDQVKRFCNYVVPKLRDADQEYLGWFAATIDEEEKTDLQHFFAETIVKLILNDVKAKPLEENIHLRDFLVEIEIWDKWVNSLSGAKQLQLYVHNLFEIVEPKDHLIKLHELSFNDQKAFFSKLSKHYIEAEQAEGLKIIISKFASLNDKQLQLYDSSLLFVCFIIDLALKNQTNTIEFGREQNEVFEFVYARLMSETLINQQLGYFFEYCDGLLNLNQAIKKIELGEKPEPIVGRWLDESGLNRYQKPCSYCEGRETTTKDNHEVFWCRNSYCARASRLNHLNKDEDDQVTITFLLYKLGLTEVGATEAAGFVNGWVNKINNYLSHLSCRACEKPLYPHNKGSGYYRCSTFSCQHSGCSEKEEEVYLNHCLNPKCVEIIDSRDSAQCDHGWYICTYCYGCCTTEKIQNRVKYKKSVGKIYNGATEGHKDLGIICCPSCGSDFPKQTEKTSRMLNRFEEMKNNRNPRIRKSGMSKGRRWFLLGRLGSETNAEFHSRVQKLNEIGFEIGGNYTFGSDTAFVAEVHGDLGIRVFKCGNSTCDHTLSLYELEEEKEFGRITAIKSFHSIT